MSGGARSAPTNGCLSSAAHRKAAMRSAVMATAVMASVPAVVLLVIAQKYVAAGTTAGAVK